MKSLPILLIISALSAAIAASYQPIEITVEEISQSQVERETGMEEILFKNVEKIQKRSIS